VILIVEDNAPLRALWVDILQHHGYVARGAGSGGEAIAAAIETIPDLVVMDLDLPDMSGFDLIEQIRPLGSFPIVALTGAELGDLSRLGFAETHLKPVFNKDVLAIADRLMPTVSGRPQTKG
jgi:CheY-like chemotaxis protein